MPSDVAVQIEKLSPRRGDLLVFRWMETPPSLHAAGMEEMEGIAKTIGCTPIFVVGDLKLESFSPQELAKIGLMRIPGHQSLELDLAD